MSDTSAGRAADTFLFPTLSPAITQAGVDTSVYTLAVSGTAAKLALTLPSNKGKVYLTVTSLTATAFIALKLGNAAAGVTTTTGFPIPAGTILSGWINPNEVDNIEAITATGTATLYAYVSSPKYEGA
jgi:hypothetical protein